MTDEPNVELSLKGRGLSYTSSITLLQAAEILRIASLKQSELPTGIRPLGVPNSTSKDNSTESLSLPEALNKAKPTTSPETIAVIATWIMDTEESDSVTRSDVASRYRDARLSLPGNLPRDFS